ncbi:MAG: hypothetical protein ACLTW9_20385 [Enterocloster sp.]
MGAVRRRSQPILDKYHEMQRQYQVLERRMEDRNSQAAAVVAWSRIMLSHGIVE